MNKLIAPYILYICLIIISVMSSLQSEFELFIENQHLKISKINDTCYLFPDSNFENIQGKFFLDFYNSRPILTIDLQGHNFFSIPESLDSKCPKYYQKSHIVQFNLDDSIKKPSDIFNELNEILKTFAHENRQKLPREPEAKSLATLRNFFSNKQFHYIELNKSNYSKIFDVPPSIWFVDVGLFTTRKFETNEIEAKCFFLSGCQMFPAGLATFFDIRCSLKEIFEYFCIKFHGKIKITQGMYDACVESANDSWIDFEIFWDKEKSVMLIDDADSGFTSSDFSMDSKALLSELFKTVQFRRRSMYRPPD